MPPILMVFVTERPPIFCLACTCLRRMLLPKTRSAEAGKFCILKTELCNLVNTFRCKVNQGDENKISVLQALSRPNCTLWMNFIGGQGWYTGHHCSGQTRKGIYPTTTLCMIVRNLVLLTNAKCSWAVQVEAFKV